MQTRPRIGPQFPGYCCDGQGHVVLRRIVEGGNCVVKVMEYSELNGLSYEVSEDKNSRRNEDSRDLTGEVSERSKSSFGQSL